MALVSDFTVICHTPWISLESKWNMSKDLDDWMTMFSLQTLGELRVHDYFKECPKTGLPLFSCITVATMHCISLALFGDV